MKALLGGGEKSRAFILLAMLVAIIGKCILRAGAARYRLLCNCAFNCPIAPQDAVADSRAANHCSE